MTPAHRALQLATTVIGSGTTVIVIHGFTGSAAAMAPLVDRLEGYRRVAVDLVGHGRSPSPPDLAPYSLEATAESLAELAVTAPDGPCHVVGYSMGGRAALALAAAHPEVCRSLSLISATAGLADAGERAQRRKADADLADRIGQHGVTRFVEDWVALPMWHTLRARLDPDDWDASIRQRRQSNPVGLANSLRAAGTGSMTPLWDRLVGIAVPTLVLCGELDTKFVTTGREMASLLPDSTLVVLAGAGHAVHLEDPDSSAAALREHLDVH
ncbi:2-succinyl-6-hydroxy-2,4-cyclohexadiene-1-carboxylate synthase [Candidatus Poriferisodalis sp.]|uniref:2-succinyl-6-hydroxy-2, 4-cyclohexadiene-1-carboxylate synthase n=1 Tax=Candidatus Poriferisodalis sp. TaxID=3101277 RepID=UPI003B51F216